MWYPGSGAILDCIDSLSLNYELTFVMFDCFCHFPMWYPGSGVVLDCIDS